MVTLLLALACMPQSVPLGGNPHDCTPTDEICDGVDNDCDGLIDDGDPDRVGAVNWFADADGDGYGDPAVQDLGCAQPVGFVADSTDCDDTSPAVNPATDEICDDLDDDCDGLVDGQDGSLTDGTPFYADADGDGFGDATSPTEACSAPPGSVADSSDCDDADPAINPDADEICDDLDDDCDGLVDGQDDSLADGTPFYADRDGDGFGDAASPTVACSAPPGSVADSSDCDDADSTVLSCASCSVAARSPARWALDVPRDADVTINADLDPSTVDDSSLVVYGDVSGYLPGTVSYASGRATFRPDGLAQPGERVTAVLTGAAQCTDGGTPGPVVWTWTAAVDGGTGVLYDAGETWTGANYSYTVVAYDFDGDGDLEVATADAQGDTVSVLDGAPGAYSVIQQVAVSGYPNFLDGGDVDQDDDVDLIVSAGSVEVLVNDGTGHFADPVTYDAAPHGSVSSARTADMDGDGDLDIVASMGFNDAVVVLSNDGSGAFTLTSAVTFSTLWGDPFPLDLGDLDGDDDIDVLAPLAAESSAAVLLNDGTGALTNIGSIALADTPKSVFIDDLDGDGDADAAIPTLYGNLLFTLTGDGSGALSTSSQALASGHGLCGGDLDADGDLDLAVPTFDHYTVVTLLNDGSAAFTTAQTLPTTRKAGSVFCADLDGDGALDVIVAGSESGDSSVTAFLNTP